MIAWRLSIIMSERRISNKKLVELTGFHPVTICNHKKAVEMPLRLQRKTLEGYCKALNCQPGELLVIHS